MCILLESSLIIDLEEAVAPSAKKEAREASLRYLEGPSINLPCLVRINAPDTRVGLDDLQAILNSSAEPDCLILPKCDSSATIRSIHNLLREAGKSTKIIALIETAKGAGALDEIVGAAIKPAALLFGAADIAADLGAETAWEPLLWVRSRIIQGAAVADIPVFDSPYFDIADVNGLKRETKASALLGFQGKCAIHPAQIAIINEVLTPTEEEVAKASQILVVNQQGVGSVDGKMVDEAIARKARLILARAGIAVEDQTCSSSTGIKSNSIKGDRMDKTLSAYRELGPKRYRETSGLYYEDFEVGDIFEHRPGRTITDVDNIWMTLLTLKVWTERIVLEDTSMTKC